MTIQGGQTGRHGTGPLIVAAASLVLLVGFGVGWNAGHDPARAVAQPTASAAAAQPTAQPQPTAAFEAFDLIAARVSDRLHLAYARAEHSSAFAVCVVDDVATCIPARLGVYSGVKGDDLNNYELDVPRLGGPPPRVRVGHIVVVGPFWQAAPFGGFDVAHLATIDESGGMASLGPLSIVNLNSESVYYVDVGLQTPGTYMVRVVRQSGSPNRSSAFVEFDVTPGRTP